MQMVAIEVWIDMITSKVWIWDIEDRCLPANKEYNLAKAGSWALKWEMCYITVWNKQRLN